MNSQRSGRRPRRPAPERALEGCSGDPWGEPETGATIAHIVDREPYGAQPARLAERPAASGCTFGSVLCVVDRTANGQAARRQAELLALPEGTVELISASQLTQHGPRALQDGCAGHDLLALGAGAAAHTAVQHARIPVLIARWCRLGTEVTDTVLVPVDGSTESSRAVELAGRLAAAHGGTVTILAAPPRDPALQRAVAASGRNLLRATGAAPRVVGEQLPRERTVPVAASALTASLVVLAVGRSEIERSMTARMIGSVGCSVLAVPGAWTDAGDQDRERDGSATASEAKQGGAGTRHQRQRVHGGDVVTWEPRTGSAFRPPGRDARQRRPTPPIREPR